MKLNKSVPISVTFKPVLSPLHNTIRVPGSKSITNRAIICAAMAHGVSRLTGVLESEDTEVMVEAWRTLGVEVDWNKESCTLAISGSGGQPRVPHGELFIANSGTSIRFLTAALAATVGDYRLDGVPRMRQRPIGDLIDGLRELGANVESINPADSNCPPVHIHAIGLRGGEAIVAGDVSSQFLSGLMMAAPYARAPVSIRVRGELVSRPYVDMTMAVMESFGGRIDRIDDDGFYVPAPQTYRGRDYPIEPDASAASYFWAAAAITGGTVRVDGLGMDSLQGDVGFVRVLEKMGCSVSTGTDDSGVSYIEVRGGELTGIDIDMNSVSDTVQTLAPVALFANGPTRIRGVAHNRHKETDRIGDLAKELRKLGSTIEEHEDGLTIHPLSPEQYSSGQRISLETYHDHRMAMSFSLLTLKLDGIVILNPRCTTKTFPAFFEVFGTMIGQAPVYEF